MQVMHAPLRPSERGTAKDLVCPGGLSNASGRECARGLTASSAAITFDVTMPRTRRGCTFIANWRRAVIPAALAIVVGGATRVTAQTPGSASFRVLQRGEVIGEAQSAVERSSDGWHITGTTRIGGTVGVTIAQFDATYDPRWRPIFLTVETVAKDQSTVVHVASLGLSTRTDVVTPLVATWGTNRISPATIFLPDYAIPAFEALAARLPTAYEGLDVPLLPAPDSEVFGTVEVVRNDPLAARSGTLATRRWQLTIAREVPTRVDVWALDGRLVRVDFPDDGISVVRSDVTTP
jgi:hypothetical protein